MHEAATQFIERLSLHLESYGLSRIAGRMLGLFLIDDQMRSLDELADDLHISKGSASTNARLLERMGVLERHGRPGDRGDFYALEDDPGQAIFEVARERMQHTAELFETGARCLPDHMEEARRRLDTWREFHAFMVEEADRQLERWEARRTPENASN